MIKNSMSLLKWHAWQMNIDIHRFRGKVRGDRVVYMARAFFDSEPDLFGLPFLMSAISQETIVANSYE